MKKIIAYLDKQSESFLIMLVSLLVLVLGVMDYLTGEEFSLFMFYLVPVSIVTWFVGKTAGLAISIASALAWLVVDPIIASAYSHPIIALWNTLERFGLFLIVTFVLTTLKGILEQERKIAENIQKNLLPQNIPQPAGCEIAYAWQRMGGVGGDYFDVAELDDRKTGICIADVAGKGMPAALLMSNLQATFKTLITEGLPPGKLCERVNQVVFKNVSQGRFISFFYCILDTGSKTLDYSNAGHNRPLLIRHDDSHRPLEKGGVVLGVLEHESFDEERIDLMPGDRLILFTDGVTEIRNPERQKFGESRLIDLSIKHRTLSAVELKDKIMAEITKYSRDHPSDDATVIVIAVE